MPITVSLPLARGEVPVCVGPRLFLPEDWCGDAGRRAAAGVPEAIEHRPKRRIALDEVDRVLAAGARFGCVLADAECGKAAEFRAGLAERRLAFAAGVLPTQKVYPADVTLSRPERKPTGRPPKQPVASAASVGAAELFAALPRAAFRTHLASHPADTPLGRLAALIEARPRPAAAGRACGDGRARCARRVCEQAHQQLKEELGLDHFEGRSWRGLHHHALLCQLAFAFLQHLRLGGEKNRGPAPGRATAPAKPARDPPAPPGRAQPRPAAPPPPPAALRSSPPLMNVAG